MADHTIEVKLQADGTPTCAPNETSGVKRGDRLIWSGVEHTGTFEGKIVGTAKKNGFAQAELVAAKLDRQKRPADADGWRRGQALTVRMDAESGAYKYSVTVGGKTVDPVVIIEDK